MGILQSCVSQKAGQGEVGATRALFNKGLYHKGHGGGVWRTLRDVPCLELKVEISPTPQDHGPCRCNRFGRRGIRTPDLLGVNQTL